ncbi:MAG: PKD domain-containing protein [Mariniphaga sp.]|nr:PKD domain-containing protein [Mariniphaga sp.]
MKNIFNNSFKLLIAFCGFALILVSCTYKEIADVDLPAPKLYMPTAVGGNYVIDNVPQRLDFLPTPGNAYQFTVDLTKSKMVIPLGVYRSGLDRSGKITASIAIKNDTIATMLAAGKIPATAFALPTDKILLPSSVDIISGSEIGTFNLEIDLNYLRSFPDAILALGVTINSTDASVNPLLKTTVLVIYTKLLKPMAAFSSKADATNVKKIVFSNISTYGMTYSWNFGDGAAVSTEKSPSYTYPAAGTYNVTLTTIGATGDLDKTTKTLSVTVL